MDLQLTEEQKLIGLLTQIVRSADRDFELTGGGTRHWVRDCFILAAKEHGYKIVLQPIEETK